MQIVQWLSEHAAIIWGSLFVVSEILDGIPSLNASSIWKMVFNFIKSKAGK